MAHRLISVDQFRIKAKADGQVSARGGAPIFKEAGCIEKGKSGELLFVLSTAAADRSNDVVDQGGWELDNYKKNPIVLFAHDHGQPPIGSSPSIGVDEKGRLVSRSPTFTDADVNPFGAMIGKMLMAGFLRAASVGFIPLEWTFNEDRGSYAMDFKRQELIEWSVVPVPANPEALVGAKSAGIDLAPMLAWASKALDEKKAPGVLELHQVEAVYKTLAPPRVAVKEHGAATVCMCEAGPLVKCQECGGHKRAAISAGAYPPPDDSDGPGSAQNDATPSAMAAELATLKARVDTIERAAVVSAETLDRATLLKLLDALEPEDPKQLSKAIADEIAALVKAEADTLLGRVS